MMVCVELRLVWILLCELLETSKHIEPARCKRIKGFGQIKASQPILQWNARISKWICNNIETGVDIEIGPKNLSILVNHKVANHLQMKSSWLIDKQMKYTSALNIKNVLPSKHLHHNIWIALLIWNCHWTIHHPSIFHCTIKICWIKCEPASQQLHCYLDLEHQLNVSRISCNLAGHWYSCEQLINQHLALMWLSLVLCWIPVLCWNMAEKHEYLCKYVMSRNCACCWSLLPYFEHIWASSWLPYFSGFPNKLYWNVHFWIANIGPHSWVPGVPSLAWNTWNIRGYCCVIEVDTEVENERKEIRIFFLLSPLARVPVYESQQLEVELTSFIPPIIAHGSIFVLPGKVTSQLKMLKLPNRHLLGWNWLASTKPAWILEISPGWQKSLAPNC